MDNLSKFAERLQDMMLENHMNGVDLERETGFSNSIIYKWLNATSAPKLNSLIVLANFYQCSIEYLTGRTDKKTVIKREVPEDFSKRLCQMMDERGLSIYALAKSIRVQRNLLKRWRDGARPTLFCLIGLAEHFNCSLDYLAGLTDKRN